MTGRRLSAPPRLWRAIVRRLTPAPRRDEIDGDLLELWTLDRERGILRASLAFWAHAWSVIVHRRSRARAIGALRQRRTLRVVADQIRSDLSYSARLARRRPAFAALTIATLALGIGASTAVFTIGDRVLLRPLPYPEPDRIVALTRVSVGFSRAGAAIAPEFLALREFAAMGMYGSGGLNLGDEATSRRVRAAAVDSGFFAVLGVRPLAGRTFSKDEDGGLKVIVLGFDVWRQAFAGDRSILDRTIRVNSQSFTVIGIMPRGFAFPERAEAWIPPIADPQITGAVYSPQVLARLASGVGPGQAVAALSRAIEDRAAHGGGHTWYPFGMKAPAVPVRPQPPTVTSLQAELAERARPTLALLVAIAGVLLAAASANVAGLLLTRLRARERELLVRSALGAERSRMIQQLVSESLVLSASGALAGLALGAWAVRLFAATVPSFAPDIALTGLDARFFAIGGGVSLLCGCAFSLGPAVAASASPASRILNDTGVGVRPAGRFGSLLIVLQVAAALLLLAATSASTSIVMRLMRVDLGFSKDQTIVFDLTLPQSRYRDETIAGFVDRLEERLRALPGVARVGTTNFALGSNRRMIAAPLWIVGEANPVVASDPKDSFAIRLAASPAYFQAMGIPLVAGRHFLPDDRRGAPLVVILGETAAHRLDPDVSDLIGKRLALDPKREAEIVGIVGSVRLYGPRGRAPLEVYEPIAQSGYVSGLTVAIDTAGDAAPIVSSAREAIAALDAEIPLFNVQQLSDVRATFLQTERVTLALSGSFAAIALVLCAVGLYGVLAQVVSQRTREIGIRMALGADRRRLRWTIVAAGLRLAALGIVAGAAASSLAFRAAARVVPQLETPELGIFAAAAATLLVVAVLAAWLPARRASGVDPVHALRSE